MKYTKTIFSVGILASLAVIAMATPQSPTPVKLVENTSFQTHAGVSYPHTIVELFTSQGCSSCPPANEFVLGLAGSEDLLALSYSVDYWDYLGWKDTHGKPEFSARQRDYGQHFQGQVYTPQIILNGAKHRSRFSKGEVSRTKLLPKSPVVSIQPVDNGIELTGVGNSATLVEVRYMPGMQSVPVARGENRGRTINLANVVVSTTILQGWSPGKQFSKTLPTLKRGEAIAILLQDGQGGPILSAVTYAP
jgi:hypothetical protein